MFDGEGGSDKNTGPEKPQKNDFTSKFEVVAAAVQGKISLAVAKEIFSKMTHHGEKMAGSAFNALIRKYSEPKDTDMQDLIDRYENSKKKKD